MIMFFTDANCERCKEVKNRLKDDNIIFAMYETYDDAITLFKYGVDIVPTIIILKGREEIFRLVGCDEKPLEELLDAMRKKRATLYVKV